MAEENLPADTGSTFLKSARDIAFIIAIYLYFSGWVYIYTYFNAFGISIRQTEMEFYYFIVYSVNVITFLIIGHWLITTCGILICITSLIVVKRSWFIYALCILLFGILYYCSILAGITDSRKDFSYRGSRLLRIKFVMKADANGERKEPGMPKTDRAAQKDTSGLHKAGLGNSRPENIRLYENIDSTFTVNNETENLRLLLSSKDLYMVIVTDRSVTYDNAFEKDKNIFTVKKDEIKLARIIK